MKTLTTNYVTRDQKLSIAYARELIEEGYDTLTVVINGIGDQMEKLSADSPEYQELDEVRDTLEDVFSTLEESPYKLRKLCPEMENVDFDVYGNVIDADGKIIEIRNRKIDGDTWTKEQ